MSTNRKKTAPAKKVAPAPEVSGNPSSGRICYVLETLRDEVLSVFPEAKIEYGEPGHWGVIHDATVTSDDAGENSQIMTVLSLLRGHAALTDVLVDEIAGTVTVKVARQPRVRDSREPLGVANGYEILWPRGSETPAPDADGGDE